MTSGMLRLPADIDRPTYNVGAAGGDVAKCASEITGYQRG